MARRRQRGPTTGKKLIAARVRKVRRYYLLTMAEMAREFGVRLLAVFRWEHGQRVMQLRHQRTLYRLEEAMEHDRYQRAEQRQRERSHR